MVQGAIACAVLVLSAMTAGAAPAVDLHRLWDDRCVECHGHAAEFARRYLSVADGALQGRRVERDLRTFLDNHYLASGEVDAVYAMLLAQASTSPRFQEDCAGCHQSAAQFARQSLQFRQGVLVGRESGQPVAEFLAHHRRLSGEDVTFFAALLDRVAREVGLEQATEGR